MENTVITQPQGSNKKKLVIGGVIAVAVIGAGIYLFSGNQSLYKGTVPGTLGNLSNLNAPAANLNEAAQLPPAPAVEEAAAVADSPAQPAVNADAVNNIVPGNGIDCSVDAADGEPEVFVAGRGCVRVSQLAAERVPAQPVLNPDAVAAVVPGNQDQQVAAPVVKNLDGELAATPSALAAPKAVDSGIASLPKAPVAADAPAAPAVNGGKLGAINVSALKNAPVIPNPNLKQTEQAPAVAVAQPVVDNFGNANSYPEQPETLKRIKELEDALAAQDRARQAASAYGDNNNQLTPEQAAAQANRLAQEAAEARVAQADAMRNAAAAGRLHGAAIQGTSGPEVLLYPILVAAANGAYFSLRRRANRK